MTHAPTITSIHNRRIVAASKLTQRKHRYRQGRFLVEGRQALHMALEANWQPIEVFYCAEQLTGSSGITLLNRLAQSTADLIAASPEVIDRLGQRCSHQGIVATFPLLHTALADCPLHGDELVIVLDRLRYPGNIGTLIRTADCVGARAVVLLEPGADVFDPKAVRASMGSLFNVPLVRSDDVPGVFDWLRAANLRLVGADANQGRWQITPGGMALVLGNEASGLADDVQRQLDTWVHLPIVGKADSLNVAVAGGVLMYGWLHAEQVTG